MSEYAEQTAPRAERGERRDGALMVASRRHVELVKLLLAAGGANGALSLTSGRRLPIDLIVLSIQRLGAARWLRQFRT